MMAINDAERWQQKKDLFQRAVAFDPAERARFLEAAADPALAREVEAMLAAHDAAPEFLEASPIARRPADPIVGRTIDQKYRVEETLGRGGMGSVYRATHLWTGRTVAVKIIAPEFMRLPEFVERFKREARAAGRLRHPNVVNVTDFGFADAGGAQLAYLVMEYLDGSTLADWLAARGRQPVELAVEVIEQTAAAVDAAHAEGILHRDLKPANIWIEPNGRGGFNVKVLDFGLAKLRNPLATPAPDGKPRPVRIAPHATLPMAGESLLSESLVDDLPTQLASMTVSDDTAQTQEMMRTVTPVDVDATTIGDGLTRAGVVMGTPAYMSPEQCAGDLLDTRSDVYSLGVVVYEILAGNPPFAGKAHDLIMKHMNVTPPELRHDTRHVPKAVEQVILTSLAKAPADRPPTAGAFAAALRAAERGDRGLLDESIGLWRAHEVVCARLFMCAHAVPAVLTALLVTAAAAPWQTTSGAVSFGRAFCWALAILTTLVSVEVGTAAFSLVVGGLRRGSRRPVCIGEVATRLGRRWAKIVAAGVRGLLQPTGLCAAPAAVVETKSCGEALARSRTIAAPLRVIAAALVARQFPAVLAVLAATLVAATLLERLVVVQGFGQNHAAGWSLVVAPLVALVTLVASVFAFGRTEMARALFYLTACRVNGTPAEEGDTPEIVVAPVSRPRLSLARPSALVALSLVGSLLLWYAYLAFVPPPQRISRMELAAAAPVPDEQNAWVLYRMAIARLSQDAEAAQLVAAKDLYAYSRGATGAPGPRLERIAAISDDTLALLVAGSRRPAAQFTTKPLTNRAPSPDSGTVMALGAVALARAGQLADQGRMDEAVGLVAATVRFGSDTADPRGSLVTANPSAVVQRACRQVVSAWLAAGRLTPQHRAVLAQALADAVDRTPAPARVDASEYAAFKQYAQTELLDSDEAVLEVLPGLRARAWLAFEREADAVHARAQAALERGDVDEYTRSIDAVREIPVLLPAIVDPPDALGRLSCRVMLAPAETLSSQMRYLLQVRSELEALEAQLQAEEPRM